MKSFSLIISPHLLHSLYKSPTDAMVSPCTKQLGGKSGLAKRAIMAAGRYASAISSAKVSKMRELTLRKCNAART